MAVEEPENDSGIAAVSLRKERASIVNDRADSRARVRSLRKGARHAVAGTAGGLLHRKLDSYRHERHYFFEEHEGTSALVETPLTMKAVPLTTNLKDHVWEVSRDLLERFDLQIHIQKDSVSRIVDEFLKSRV